MAEQTAVQTGKRLALQHLNHSQSQVILWLLEELDIPGGYELNLFERNTTGPHKARAPLSLQQSHVIGKSPQLVLPNGRVIIERSAISYYLIETYDTTGRFKRPLNDPNNDAVREEELLSLGANSLYVVWSIAMLMATITKQSPFFIRPLTSMIESSVNSSFLAKEFKLYLRYLDDQLAGREWFMGTREPTRVDINMMWYIDAGLQTGKSEFGQAEFAKYEKLKSWYQRCLDRPAWQRALKKGNGYDLTQIAL